MVLGWTGGQYSIYRVLLAWVASQRAYIGLTDVVAPWADWPGLVIGISGLALALGYRDRWAAVVLGVLIVFAAVGEAVVASSTAWDLLRADLIVPLFLLALHLRVPPRPFGGWEARSRPDPAGEWQLPRRIWHAAWIGLGIAHGLAVLGVAERPDSSGLAGDVVAIAAGALHVFVVAAAIHPPLRRAAWSSIMLWQIAWHSASGWSGSEPSLWLLHLLAVDPGWLPARSWLLTRGAAQPEDASRSARLFYDGECGLCHRSVRFVLAEESATPPSLRLRFAPLESRSFEALRARREDALEALPDSLVLELEDGRLCTRSRAVLEIASRLGGLWRALSLIGRVLPRVLLDRAYDLVARVRKRIFARPSESCPLLPPALRDRVEH